MILRDVSTKHLPKEIAMSEELKPELYSHYAINCCFSYLMETDPGSPLIPVLRCAINGMSDELAKPVQPPHSAGVVVSEEMVTAATKAYGVLGIEGAHNLRRDMRAALVAALGGEGK
jgi:hypothetical protein